MAALDSEAVLAERCAVIGLTPAQLGTITAAGLTTMSRVAFSCGYVPGSPDDTDLRRLMDTLFTAGNVTPLLAACFRRLHFESYSLACADVRQRVSPEDAAVPRRLPNAERAARATRQQAALVGMVLTGEYEPSHALVDLCYDMHEQNLVQLIPWEQCTRREQELQGIKKDPVLKLENGLIKLVPGAFVPRADLISDLKVRNALVRRGLALEQGFVLSYAVHEQWVCKIFKLLQAHPPAGYEQITFEQLKRADTALFVKLCEATRGGIRPDATGVLPCDAQLLALMQDPEVTFLLLPLPSGRSSQAKVQPQPAKTFAAAAAAYSNEAAAAQPAGKKNKKRKASADANPGKGGGGKGKGGGGGGPPPSLQHYPLLSGKCWNFNGAGCTLPVTGNRCRRGVHACAKCGQNHNVLVCPN